MQMVLMLPTNGLLFGGIVFKMKDFICIYLPLTKRGKLKTYENLSFLVGGKTRVIRPVIEEDT